jgi:hypothetical protein
MRRGKDVFVAGLAPNHRASLGEQTLADTIERRWLPGTPLTIAQSVVSLFDPSYELQRQLDWTGNQTQLAPAQTNVQPASAPIAALPDSSPIPEPGPARRLWTSMDTTIVVIASVAIAGAAAILIWLFAPWST